MLDHRRRRFFPSLILLALTTPCISPSISIFLHFILLLLFHFCCCCSSFSSPTHTLLLYQHLPLLVLLTIQYIHALNLLVYSPQHFRRQQPNFHGSMGAETPYGSLFRKRNLQSSKAPLRSQAQGSSLFSSSCVRLDGLSERHAVQRRTKHFLLRA